MRELLQAIKTRFDSSTGADLRALSSSQMFLGVAPDSASGDYITIRQVSGETEWTINSQATTTGGDYERVLVDFHCWTSDRSPLAAWEMVEALKDLYDHAILTTSGYTMLHAKRTTPGVHMQQWDQDGNDVVVSYEYRLGKSTSTSVGGVIAQAGTVNLRVIDPITDLTTEVTDVIARA